MLAAKAAAKFKEEKMSLTLNTNLLSLNTQMNLSNTQAPLAQAMQRLSSGLRINSSKDDAAGLAIATRMQRQIGGLTVAMRNANDGVSFAQTAEGAMTEMVNNLQRIYELSNQASSYNTSTDRGSMNQEVSQLISELNRIVTQTRFNGQQFLNQSFSGNFQVGTEVNETISIATSSVSPNSFGVQSTRSDFTSTTANMTSIASSVARVALGGYGLSAAATINGVDVGAAINYSDTINNSLNVINRINQYTGSSNVTAFAFGNAYISTGFGITAASTGVLGGISAGFLTINGISIGSTGTIAASLESNVASALVTAINNKTTQTGITAILLGSNDVDAAAGTGSAGIALINTNGAAITVSVATASIEVGNGGSVMTANYFGTGGSVAAGQNGQITYSTPLGTTAITLNAGSDAAALGLATTNTSISVSNRQSINDVSINTVGGASLAILAVSSGLDTLNSQKAQLGAIMNRFDSTIRNITNVRQNITAAKSRIMDADYAAETANLTKAMITQQAGISVLAQANTISQQVLALLK